VPVALGVIMLATMHITARLELSVIRRLLDQLLPATVRLDDDDDQRWIRIDPARNVDLVPGEGLRIDVGGQLAWTVAGVAVQLTIHSAQLLLAPQVVDRGGDGRLVFRPSLEKMDLKNVPGVIDSGVTALINRRLEAEGDKLAWHFDRDISNRFPLGADFAEGETFVLGGGAASVEVLTDAIVFDLPLEMAFERPARSPSGHRS
jgi:hypothetical protein